MKRLKNVCVVFFSIIVIIILSCCNNGILNADSSSVLIDNDNIASMSKTSLIENTNIIEYNVPLESLVVEADIQYNHLIEQNVFLDKSFRFATYSQINTGFAKLYTNNNYNKKDFVVCVNAGHGVVNGEKYEKTYSHPDFTAKYTSGSNGKSVKSYAITSGMVFNNGQPEHLVNLKVAKYLKDILLLNGYSVLMIREDSNSFLDNIARTVLANNYADCHISIHFDSTESDAGIFYITAITKKEYIEMEPVKSIYKESEILGRTLINTFRQYDEKIKGKGVQYQDLTQISYSTIPTVDLELGDKISDISDARLHQLAEELYDGIDEYRILKNEKG